MGRDGKRPSCSLGNFIAVSADLILCEGRQGWVRGELLGSPGICGNSKELFVSPSRSLCCGSSPAGFHVAPLLLASNFRQLGLPRPEPCFERETPQLLSQH
ncbi:colorectal cancer-associated protein 1 [Loxodonta africana]|uniref:colorectal cancer-associated protein 1 n=1 Tax=Loxodonta africana TaxID=9785 RepID=UPI000C810B27|nr:colorectal cancer-associated protein 1 [Loxodonta africana]